MSIVTSPDLDGHLLLQVLVTRPRARPIRTPITH